MDLNYYYERFLEKVYELADFPASPDTFFISNSPNLDEEFLNSFISELEQEIRELEDTETDNYNISQYRDRLLTDYTTLYGALTHESIYDLAHYETDYTHDDLPLTDDADEIAEMISERDYEIKSRLIENATPYLDLIKETLSRLI